MGNTSTIGRNQYEDLFERLLYKSNIIDHEQDQEQNSGTRHCRIQTIRNKCRKNCRHTPRSTTRRFSLPDECISTGRDFLRGTIALQEVSKDCWDYEKHRKRRSKRNVSLLNEYRFRRKITRSFRAITTKGGLRSPRSSLATLTWSCLTILDQVCLRSVTPSISTLRKIYEYFLETAGFEGFSVTLYII